MLELCRWRRLVTTGAAIVSRAAASGGSGPFSFVLLRATRWTAFSHFCGGERLDECVEVARRLSGAARVRCIVDWSVEEREDADSWGRNAERKAATLQEARAALGEDAAFMPLKLTALLSPTLLERISRMPVAAVAPGGDIKSGIRDWLVDLGSEDRAMLESALTRLRMLCGAARDCGVPLLLDAEQTQRQPAVHLIARILQAEFNAGAGVVVYDTLQMYLRSSPARLEQALASARGRYTYAVKLVRGAYIEQERAGAGPHAVHATKADTDAAYDSASSRLLACVARARPDGPGVAVMMATHNRASLQRATSEMERLDVPRGDPRVQFAQILGMVDNLTNALGLAGYNASKLVVFGDLCEVLPWLLRRVEENRDAFAAQAYELPVLRAELLRRLLRRGRGGSVA